MNQAMDTVGGWKKPLGEPSGSPQTPSERSQESLWRDILALSAYVEVALRASVDALCGGKTELISAVRAEEAAVDRWEVRVEQECLRVLALYGLVASDLRRIVVAMRVNRELEGISDLAENLAKRAKKISKTPAAAPFLPKIRSLAEKAIGIVDDSIRALREMDADLARQATLADDAVDRERAALVAELKEAVKHDPDRLGTWLRLINSARNLERAADHATNIAEAVIYMKDGVNVRRGKKGFMREDD